MVRPMCSRQSSYPKRVWECSSRYYSECRWSALRWMHVYIWFHARSLSAKLWQIIFVHDDDYTSGWSIRVWSLCHRQSWVGMSGLQTLMSFSMSFASDGLSGIWVRALSFIGLWLMETTSNLTPYYRPSKQSIACFSNIADGSFEQSISFTQPRNHPTSSHYRDGRGLI